MGVYYNEHDPKAAAWIRALIEAGHLPGGFVDERSIEDVPPAELERFSQHHFFAGIAGWAYALRLAQWPAHVPVWTGSCPCQPFSQAGVSDGTTDDRHLWPAFRWLVAQCKPAIIFGEQVASKAGRDWLSGVRSDLEAMEYAVGSADLCAASVGAPHIRQRLWFVAHTSIFRLSLQPRDRDKIVKGAGTEVYIDGSGNGEHPAATGVSTDPRGNNPWDSSCSKWITCTDTWNRQIPTEPAFYPLAHGFPLRVDLLRCIGNAIVPQLASQFIQASIEAILP